MDSVIKQMYGDVNLQKSLNIMGKHFSAVQEFEKNNSYLRSIQKYDLALKSAGDSLLAMQGINKNILGMQSIIEQNRPLMNILSSMSETMKLSSNLSSNVESIGITRHLPRNSLMEMATGVSSSMPSTIAALFETHNRLNKNPTFQAIIDNQHFLQRISEQSPFISAVQRHTSSLEKIFGNSSVLAQMAESKTLFNSALSVAASALNFSSALYSLSIDEQQKIVALLEQLDLDDDVDVEVSEALPDELQEECDTFIVAIRTFWKDNSEYLLGIAATADTTVKSLVTNDIDGNIFTIVLFVYYWVNLLVNFYLKCKNISDDNNSDDNKNE